jgi:hypothetical protein
LNARHKSMVNVVCPSSFFDSSSHFKSNFIQTTVEIYG